MGNMGEDDLQSVQEEEVREEQAIENAQETVQQSDSEEITDTENSMQLEPDRAQDAVQNVEITDGQISSVKKKSKAGIILGIVLAAVVLAAGAVFLIGKEKVSNTFHRTFSSDVSYYDWVEQKRVDQVMDMIFDMSGKKDSSCKMTLDLTLGDMLTSFIPLKDMITLEMTVTNGDMKNYDQINLSYGGEQFIALNSIEDIKEKKAYIAIPELSDSYMVQELDQIGKDDEEIGILERMLLSDRGKLKEFAKKYGRLFVSELKKEVSVSGEEKFSLDDKTVSGRKVTASIHTKDIYPAFVSVLKEMKQDKKLMEVLAEADIKQSESKTYIDSLIDNMEKAQNDKDEVVQLTCYVNEAGDIVARTMKEEDKENDFESSMLCFVENGCTNYSFGMNNGEKPVFSGRFKFEPLDENIAIPSIDEKKVLTKEEYENAVDKEKTTQLFDKIKSIAGLGGDVSALPGMDDNILGDEDIDGKQNPQPDAITPQPEAKPVGQVLVTLGEYKGIKVKMEPVMVLDAEIEEQLERLNQSYGTYVKAEDKTEVQMGDVANIDYEGKIDGTAFQGGTDTGANLLIGSGSFIPGFEEGLIGAKVGETIDVPVTFPDPYTNNPSMSGKEAVFTIKVNFISSGEMEPLTDQIVADNTQYKTIEEYKKYISDTIMSQKESAANTQKEIDILNKVIENAEFVNLNEQEYEDEASSMKNYYTSLAAQYGIDLGTYINLAFGEMTEEQFCEQLKTAAEFNVKQRYLLDEVVNAEKITISDDEYNEMIKEYMAGSNYKTIEEFEKAYNGKDEVMKALKLEKALDLILDSAVVTQ